jgi:preprotein translocase subunit SecG
MMQTLNIFHVLIAIGMVAFILIQKGAGATAGAAFGSGASGTVFGSRGAGNFLSRSTWVLATLFCLISLTMAVMASRASISPETDLGVIGNAAPTEEVNEQGAQDLPVLLNNSDSLDVPSIDATSIEAVEAENAGDLPVIEEPVASDGEG